MLDKINKRLVGIIEIYMQKNMEKKVEKFRNLNSEKELQ
jgi:hypothetical protein